MEANKFSMSRKDVISVIAGPLAFAAIYWMVPLAGLSVGGRGVLATLTWMAIWWMAEFIPSGITGLVPLVLFPVIGSLDASATASAYGNNTIFLLLGGFAIGIAIEKWELHNVIALNIINVVGASTSNLFIGLLLTATFISMWVSNVATALMVLPIASAISTQFINLMKKQKVHTETEATNFKKRLAVAVVLGAIIGGSMTLIGTPTNTQLSGFYAELYGLDLSFGQFLIFELPIAIVQLIVVTFLANKVLYKMDVKRVEGGKEFVQAEKERIGKMTFEQKTVLGIFAVTVFFWITRTFIWADIIPGINDGMIAMAATIVLFSMPTKGAASEKSKRFLAKTDISKISWDVLLMIGGGMAIAAGFSGTDLASWIGQLLLVFENTPQIVTLSMVAILSILVTQMAPNTASGSILIPIAATLADSIGMDPLVLMSAAALGAGFAFTFPSGTPAMGVLYSRDEFIMADLLKIGIPMVIVSVIMIILTITVWLPIVL